jgi:hypothetical protein
MILKSIGAWGLFFLPFLSIYPIYGYDILDRVLDPLKMSEQPPGRAFQFSSYDRYGGNGDGGTFLGTDPDGSKIMAEISGPGVISRIWVTRQPFPSDARFRIFVDNTTIAVVDTLLRPFFGTMNPFVPPLADSAAGGYFCYVPIHFQDTCRITLLPTLPSQTLYYQITGITLPETTRVTPFTLPLPSEWSSKLNIWWSMWDSAGAYPWTLEDTLTQQMATVLVPGQIDTLLTISLPGVLYSLTMTTTPFTQDCLRNLIMRVYWDGSLSPSVEGSLSDIFGPHWGPVTIRAVPIGCIPPTLYFYFPCPFDNFVLTVENQATSSISIQARMIYKNADPGEMRFCAATHYENATPYGQNYTLLNIEGRGYYIGCQMYMASLLTGFDHNFLEGDQQIRVDSEQSPSIHGTGTEDDFNGGYYFLHHPFIRPIHGAPWWNQTAKQTAAYRFHLTDMIPFDSSIVVSTEHGPFNNVPAAYQSVAYYYKEASQIESSDPSPEGVVYHGEHISICGWGFSPQYDITMYWGNTSIVTEPQSLATDNQGRFQATIATPETLAGFYRLGTSAGGGDICRDSRILEYCNERIFEYHLSGMDTIAYPQIDTLFLEGEGFIPSSTVRFFLSNNEISCLESPILVDSGSIFSAAAIIPEVIPGSYSLMAVPSEGSALFSQDSLCVNYRWVLEAERLLPLIASSGDYCGAQFMAYPWNEGQWGDNLQLELQSDAIGDFMTMGLTLPEAGYWDIYVGYTLYHYGGNFDISFQGTEPGPIWYSYSSTTRHSGLVSLGTRYLTSQTSVTFRVVGRQPQAQYYRIGIDRLEFVPGTLPADTSINDLTIGIRQGQVWLNWSPIKIDSAWHWVNASHYDIHRFSTPTDSISSSSFLATVADTSLVDTTALLTNQCAFYRIIGH